MGRVRCGRGCFLAGGMTGQARGRLQLFGMHRYVFLPARRAGRLKNLGGGSIGVGASASASWLWILRNGQRGNRALARRSARRCWGSTLNRWGDSRSGGMFYSPLGSFSFEVGRHVCSQYVPSMYGAG